LTHGWSSKSFIDCKNVLNVCHSDRFDASRIHCLAQAYKSGLISRRVAEIHQNFAAFSLVVCWLLIAIVFLTRMRKVISCLREHTTLPYVAIMTLLLWPLQVCKVEAVELLENLSGITTPSDLHRDEFHGKSLVVLTDEDQKVLIVAKNIMSWWSEFHTMTWSSLWHTVPFAVMCIIIGGMITILYPALRYGLIPLFRDLVKGLFWILKKIMNSFCCVAFCAGSPFVWLRIKFRKFWLNYWIGRNIRTVEELVPLDEIIIGHSRFRSDESGMFLQHGSVKIYLDNAPQDALMVATAPVYSGNTYTESQGRKETNVSSSRYFKANEMPKFQGWFEVSGIVIGHFSRVDYENQDCLLTAFHVFEYNKNADILICHDNIKLRLSEIPVKVVSYSRSEDLDFMIMEMPSKVFSMLKLKVGKFAPSCGLGSPVSIYQFKDKEGERIPCFTVGCVSKDIRSWYFKHGASTETGSSGAPILNSKMNIVGVHVEGGSNNFNYGVVPPVLRCKRESPQNDDIVSTEKRPRWATGYESDSDSGNDDDDYYSDAEDTNERRANDAAQREEDEQARVERAQVLVQRERDTRREFKMRAWFEVVDENEQDEEEVKSDDEETFVPASIPKYKQRIPAPVSRRRESPWTCVQCGVTQAHHGFSCIKCGMPMVPAAVAADKAATAVTTVSQIVDEANLPSVCMLKILDELKEMKERMVKFEKIEAIFSKKSNYGSFSGFGKECITEKSFKEMAKAIDGLKIDVLEMDKKLFNSMKHKNSDKNNKVKGDTLTSVTTGEGLNVLKVPTLSGFHSDTKIVPINTVNRVKDSEKELKKASVPSKVELKKSKIIEKAQELAKENEVLKGALERDVKLQTIDEKDRIASEQASAKRKLKAANRRAKEKERIAAIKSASPNLTTAQARAEMVLKRVKETQTVTTDNVDLNLNASPAM